jgi:hypothetical protein
VSHQQDSTTELERGTSVAPERLRRAMGTLLHTHRSTGVDWLHALTASKAHEAVARIKLESCGYHVRFDRTNPRSVW